MVNSLYKKYIRTPRSISEKSKGEYPLRKISSGTGIVRFLSFSEYFSCSREEKTKNERKGTVPYRSQGSSYRKFMDIGSPDNIGDWRFQRTFYAYITKQSQWAFAFAAT